MIRLLNSSLLVLLLVLGLASSLSADESSPAVSSAIEGNWRVVTSALDSGDYDEALDAVVRLDVLRRKYGFRNMEDYSLELMRRAGLLDPQSDAAEMLMQSALRLSPASIEIAFGSFSRPEPSSRLRPAAMFSLLLSQGRSDPSVWLKLFSEAALPLLWAVTAALYACFAMVLLSDFGGLIRRFAMFFPADRRGLLAPPALAVLLCLPCFLGMHWSLLVWSAAVLWLLPERRQLVYLAGLLLVLWAVLLPLSRNLRLWLGDPDVRAMIKTAAGNYVPGDEGALWLLSSRYPDDPVVYYLLGRVLLREGRFAEADGVFKRGQEAGGLSSLLSSEQGISALIQGRTTEAGKYFAAAESAGAKSPEFLFNHSKVKLELLDTESSHRMLKEVEKRKPELLREYGERENQLGMKNPLAWPQERLPLPALLRSALAPVAQLDKVLQRAIAGIMPSATPVFMGICGLLLLLSASARGSGRKAVLSQRGFGAFSIAPSVKLVLRFIPGGAFALGGKAGSCFVVLFILSFALLPFVLDLPGLRTVQQTGAWRVYQVGVLLLAVLLSLLSLGVERRSSDA